MDPRTLPDGLRSIAVVSKGLAPRVGRSRAMRQALGHHAPSVGQSARRCSTGRAVATEDRLRKNAFAKPAWGGSGLSTADFLTGKP